MTRLALLNGDRCEFPPPSKALRDPNGLLAAGGDLSVERLLAAYSRGIFPWFNDDHEPILWWSPDPRAVLLPEELHVSRRLARRIRSGAFSVTMDRAFGEVMQGCAAPRAGASGTWITARMRRAYHRLHRAGYAHSVEVWQQDQLCGGLYGISIGRMFFGESMFSREPDASKVALATLMWQIERWGFALLDCQVMNPHLRSLGAREMPRAEFLDRLAESNRHPTRQGLWQMDEDGRWNSGRTG
jgi:leucyl/phenylalanyl-tRNA---protein transferase